MVDEMVNYNTFLCVIFFFLVNSEAKDSRPATGCEGGLFFYSTCFLHDSQLTIKSLVMNDLLEDEKYTGTAFDTIDRAGVECNTTAIWKSAQLHSFHLGYGPIKQQL